MELMGIWSSKTIFIMIIEMKQGINADLQTYSELYHMHVIPFFLEKFGDDNCYCEIFLFFIHT